MFFGGSVVCSSIFGDMGEESVGEGGPSVDIVSGLLYFLIGFFSIWDIISVSVTSSESILILVEIRYETKDVFSSF